MSDEGSGTYGLSEAGVGAFGRSSLAEGVYGESDSAAGVLGYSPSDAGVGGESITGAGGYFTSEEGYGVRAESSSTSAGNAAVFGSIGPTGLLPSQEIGVRGDAAGGYGVAGYSSSSAGVYGYSQSYYGVWGTTGSNYYAVYGYNTGSGAGVSGQSSSGTGVYGYSSGSYGGYFYSGSGMALRASGDAEVSGDLTVGGDVQADRVTYSSPRSHVFVVGSEAFLPSANVDYSNGSGCGGAYVAVSPGGYRMMAPVHLPQDATVTRFQVFFYDTSTRDLSVELSRQNLAGCGFHELADINSSGTSGYYSLTETTILNAVIDNTRYSYHVDAWGNPWDGSALMVKGAVITYEISEAP
jgi:hypothetical protein